MKFTYKGAHKTKSVYAVFLCMLIPYAVMCLPWQSSPLVLEGSGVEVIVICKRMQN